MAKWDNQHTKEEQEHLDANFAQGVVDGDKFVGYPLPEFASKPVVRLTAYERGFLAAWWLKQWIGK